MRSASVDFETRSDADLRRRGYGPYFESPHWRALICCYSIDGGPMQTWLGGPCPADLRAHIESGGLIRAHNASFERQCFNELARREGWPQPAIEQYRCTAAEAAAMALPRSLEGVGEALGLAITKDKRGAALIRKFCSPRRPRAGEPPGLYWNEPEDHPDDFAAFVAYCARDVETEQAAAARLVPLSDHEWAVYHLGERINDRGIRIDIVSAQAALQLAERAKSRLDAEIRQVTGGAVHRTSEVSKLVAWVAAQGVDMATAGKAEVLELLELDDLPSHVRRALEIRQEAAKTSVQKLKAMVERAARDGRVRGAFMYHAASTGRFQSNGVNFANMPRPRRVFDDAHLDRETLFRTIRQADPDLLQWLYGDALGRPLHLISDAVRGFVWAAPGHDFVQADYSGIEGAVIAWSSDEEWKVAAMHEIIADEARAKKENSSISLPDMYVRLAASIMGVPIESIRIGKKKGPNDWMRQSIGKISDLALGFGGGCAAFYSMSLNYGVKLDPLFAPVWATADAERREKAERRYAACLKRRREKTDLLSRDAWLACELIKVGWRAANSAIAAGWKLREEAVREAVRNPGTETRALCFRYRVAHGFLWARLPSGRCLAYGSPRLKDQVWANVRLDDGSLGDPEVMGRDEAEKLELRGLAQIKGPTSPAVTALGVNSTTKKFERFPLYGGLIAENDTQAIARDLLVNGMFRAEAAGYPIVAHVYDEIIAEIPRGTGDLTAFEREICVLPNWAKGLPLTAGGWRGKRYRKD